MSFLAYPLDHLPFVFLVLLISFSVHEFAHARFADRFGDPTPRSMGRVTLNPRVHLDMLGMIFFLLIGVGWAKPVLVNRSKFSRPRLMGIVVSVMGPLSNLALAFIFYLLFALLLQQHAFEGMANGVEQAIKVFFRYMITTNVFLLILNLLPFPPLDGYRILEDVLPRRLMMKLKKYEQWMFYAILLMFFIPPIREVTLGPIFSISNVFYALFEVIAVNLFGAGIIR